jgi:hypothetical protein
MFAGAAKTKEMFPELWVRSVCGDLRNRRDPNVVLPELAHTDAGSDDRDRFTSTADAFVNVVHFLRDAHLFKVDFCLGGALPRLTGIASRSTMTIPP